MTWRYIVCWRSGRAEQYECRDEVIETVADSETRAVCRYVTDVIVRESGRFRAEDRERLDRECADYIADILAEQRHRAELRRAHREAAL